MKPYMRPFGESNIATLTKVERHRAKLRAEGLRPLQIWVPDTRTPELVDQVKRQVRKLKDDPAERDITGFTEEAASQTEGWQ